MVYSFVEERNGLALLKDKRVLMATADVSGISMNKTEVWNGYAYYLYYRHELMNCGARHLIC